MKSHGIAERAQLTASSRPRKRGLFVAPLEYDPCFTPTASLDRANQLFDLPCGDIGQPFAVTHDDEPWAKLHDGLCDELRENDRRPRAFLVCGVSRKRARTRTISITSCSSSDFRFSDLSRAGSISLIAISLRRSMSAFFGTSNCRMSQPRYARRSSANCLHIQVFPVPASPVNNINRQSFVSANKRRKFAESFGRMSMTDASGLSTFRAGKGHPEKSSSPNCASAGNATLVPIAAGCTRTRAESRTARFDESGSILGRSPGSSNAEKSPTKRNDASSVARSHSHSASIR